MKGLAGSAARHRPGPSAAACRAAARRRGRRRARLSRSAAARSRRLGVDRPAWLLRSRGKREAGGVVGCGHRRLSAVPAPGLTSDRKKPRALDADRHGQAPLDGLRPLRRRQPRRDPGRDAARAVRAGIAPDLIVGTSAGALERRLHRLTTADGRDRRRAAAVWRGLSRGQVFPLNPLTGLLGFLGSRDHLVPDSGLRRLIARHVEHDRLEADAGARCTSWPST